MAPQHTVKGGRSEVRKDDNGWGQRLEEHTNDGVYNQIIEIESNLKFFNKVRKTKKYYECQFIVFLS